MSEIGFKFTGFKMYGMLIVLGTWGIIGWIGLFSIILGLWR